jgi:hypothetical protein
MREHEHAHGSAAPLRAAHEPEAGKLQWRQAARSESRLSSHY